MPVLVGAPVVRVPPGSQLLQSLGDLPVLLLVEVELVNRKLCDDVLATVQLVQSDAAVVLWSQSLVVRSQMVLVEMRSPMAELLGRVIDGSVVKQ